MSELEYTTPELAVHSFIWLIKNTIAYLEKKNINTD